MKLRCFLVIEPNDPPFESVTVLVNGETVVLSRERAQLDVQLPDKREDSLRSSFTRWLKT